MQQSASAQSFLHDLTQEEQPRTLCDCGSPGHRFGGAFTPLADFRVPSELEQRVHDCTVPIMKTAELGKP